MKKPKPGDRTKMTSGKHEGRIGAHKRHTDNGAANQGCVLLMGEADERRLWLSSMRVRNESTQMERVAARKIAALAMEMSELSVEETTAVGRWRPTLWTNNSATAKDDP